MSAFLLRKYDVTVQGFSAHAYDANSPAQARVRAWYAYCSYRHVSFKEFMKISSVRRGTDPDGYGQPILVSGKPAFLVSRDAHTVRFVRPDDTQVLNSHPLDVTEADPPPPAETASEAEESSFETCERCQGNGEIVTDWERYRHPHEGDVGDEAVAECPDCGGEGVIDRGPPPAERKNAE